MNNASTGAAASESALAGSGEPNSTEESSAASFFSIYTSRLSDTSTSPSASSPSDSSTNRNVAPLGAVPANGVVDRGLQKPVSKPAANSRTNAPPNTNSVVAAAAIPAASITPLSVLPPNPLGSPATVPESAEESGGQVGTSQISTEGIESKQNGLELNGSDLDGLDFNKSGPGTAEQSRGQSGLDNLQAGEPATMQDADSVAVPPAAIGQGADAQLTADAAAVLSPSEVDVAAAVAEDSDVPSNVPRNVPSGVPSLQSAMLLTTEDSNSNGSQPAEGIPTSFAPANGETLVSLFPASIAQPSTAEPAKPEAHRESAVGTTPRSVSADVSTVGEVQKRAADTLTFPASNAVDNVAAALLGGFTGSSSGFHLQRDLTATSAPATSMSPGSSTFSPVVMGGPASYGSGGQRTLSGNQHDPPQAGSNAASSMTGATSESNAWSSPTPQQPSQPTAHTDPADVASVAGAASLSQIVATAVPVAPAPIATDPGTSPVAVTTPKTGEADPPTTPDSNPTLAGTSAVSIAPVQMARMVDGATQSEMRIGMTTSAFGSVEVRTQVRANEVGVTIGSERGDLRMLLAPEIPGLTNRLQQQSLRLSPMNFHESSTFSGNSSAGGDSPRRFFSTPTAPASTPVEVAAETASPPATPESLHGRHAGLSVLA